MPRPIALSILFFLFCLAIGCKQAQTPLSVTTEALSRRIPTIERGTYLIKPGDKLSIKNLNWLSDLVPEPGTISGESVPGLNLLVDVNGQIGVPEIGKITVTGLTPQKLSDSLSIIYKNILRAPLFETQVTNLKVKVLGAVGHQGIVLLDKEHQTLGEILAQSGGIQYTEAGNTIKIIRGDGTEQRVIEFNFQELGDPLVMNQPVFENDIVYITPSKATVASAKLQKNFSVLQPLFYALNITILMVNLLRQK